MKDLITNDIKEINRRLEENNISFEDKVVLVTGGAGFLGSWVCDVLVSQGAYCICLDNLTSGSYQNINHNIGKDNFRFIHYDISKPIFFGFSQHSRGASVADIPNIDIVMHMASRASPFEFEAHPISILKSNTIGTMNALGIAKAHNALLFFTSTSEIYGDVPSEHIPTSEEYNGNVDPLSIRAPYDESKRTGEAFCKAYELRHKVKVSIVRIFNTYGPRMKWGPLWGRAVSNFCHSALLDKPIEIFGTGNQTRSFTYVVDEIEGFLRMISTKEAIGKVMNLGNDNEMSILNLAKTIKELANSKSELVYRELPEGDPQRRCPDLSRIKRIVGWTPTIEIEEGISKTLEWMKGVIQR
ncbi:MAG: GDP-mannose 4,6-dehydratase [Promethearchaeia archaeon]